MTEVRGKRLSKVELYEKIRLVRRDESLSVRALAARFKVHRREVCVASDFVSQFASSFSQHVRVLDRA